MQQLHTLLFADAALIIGPHPHLLALAAASSWLIILLQPDKSLRIVVFGGASRLRIKRVPPCFRPQICTIDFIQ